MRFLVTGAAGFIGSRLVDVLSARGHAVRALVRRQRLSAPACGEVVVGDVTELATLLPAVSGCEVVVHCAHGGTTLEDCTRINEGGTRNVLEAAQRGGARRVVYLSSWRVHGRHLPERVHEDLPLVTHGNPYDVSKARAERFAFDYALRHGLEFVALRPTIVYGPGCGPWIETFVERLKYERLRLIDGGRGVANVVYVDDLVDAIVAAAAAPGAAGQAYLVSGAPAPSWREYLEPLCAALHKPLPASVPGWAAQGVAAAGLWHYRFTRRSPALEAGDLGLFVERATVSIDKAQRHLGYQPRVGITTGMAAVVDHLRTGGLIGIGEGEPRKRLGRQPLPVHGTPPRACGERAV